MEAQKHFTLNSRRPNPLSARPLSGGYHYAQTISRATNLQLPPSQHYAMTMQAPLARYQQVQVRSQPPPVNYYYCTQPEEVAGYTMGLAAHEKMLSQQQQEQHKRYQEASLVGLLERQSLLNRPLCRCRVMYLGSSVPHITKNGLHGIQEPLRLLYPEEKFTGSKQLLQSSKQLESTTIDISHLSSSLGIDSWLSVWSNGLLLENVDEFGHEIKRFFSIESLHYCAAVRFFDTSTLMREPAYQQAPEPEQHKASEEPDQNNNLSASEPEKARRKGVVRFLPLDAPLFQCPGMVDPKHPPVFASIMRRTSGIKVLECHAFICRRDAASNALVRCCTQAYADLLNAKRLSAELSRGSTYNQHYYNQQQQSQRPASSQRRARSLAARRTIDYSDRSVEDAGSSAGSSSENNINHSTSKSSALPSSATENVSSGPEDNYAIINKGAGRTLERSRPRKSERQAAIASRKQRGSSRSLYDDFQPKSSKSAGECPEGSACCPAGRSISHSLDLVKGEGSCCPDELKPGDGACCPMVANKRHSKSMQELDGPFEFEPNGSGRSSWRRESRSRSRSNKVQQQQSGKKAQSYQDMRSQRKSSLSSFKRREESRPAPAANRGHYEQPQEDQRRQIRHKSSSRRRPDGTWSSSRRNSEALHYASALPAPPSNHQNNHYQQPNLIYHAPAPPPPLPLGYMHPASYYGANYPAYAPGAFLGHAHQPQQAHQQILYNPQNLYEGCPYSQGSTHYNYAPPYAHYADQSTDPQHAYSVHLLGTQTLAARKSRGTSGNSQTLAARFRCLSPPQNLFGQADQRELPREPASKPAGNQEDATGSGEGSQTGDFNNVVSAQPAFSNSSTTRQKKASWIKRLSLTMSTSSHLDRVEQAPTSGHESDSATTSVARTLTKEPAASKQEPAPNKKKRSSIFSGNLTLGRKRNSKPSSGAN